MNLKEYEKVKNFSYLEYCDYLQNKYGKSKANYFYAGCNSKNKNCRRTKDGLFTHHKYEDRARKLSDSISAKNHPFEYQLAENLIYCDYLEHLLLHILICENPQGPDVGWGGITELVPELNDFYSGFESELPWQITVFDKVKNDMDVYLILLRRFYTTPINLPRDFIDFCIYSSKNEAFGSWSKKLNRKLFKEIKKIIIQ